MSRAEPGYDKISWVIQKTDGDGKMAERRRRKGIGSLVEEDQSDLLVST